MSEKVKLSLQHDDSFFHQKKRRLYLSAKKKYSLKLGNKMIIKTDSDESFALWEQMETH